MGIGYPAFFCLGMKFISLCPLFFLYLSLALSLEVRAGGHLAAVGELIVDIHGVTSDAGSIQISLLSSEFQWQHREAEFCVVRKPARKGKMRWVFKDVPYGEYALFVYHDIDGNGKFDRNWRGVPVEPYAMSGKGWQSLTAPTFLSAKFHLQNTEQTVAIGLISPKQTTLMRLLGVSLTIDN